MLSICIGDTQGKGRKSRSSDVLTLLTASQIAESRGKRNVPFVAPFFAFVPCCHLPWCTRQRSIVSQAAKCCLRTSHRLSQAFGTKQKVRRDKKQALLQGLASAIDQAHSSLSVRLKNTECQKVVWLLLLTCISCVLTAGCRCLIPNLFQ